MAEVALLPKYGASVHQVTDTFGFDEFVFDATLSEGLEKAIDWTKNPVEGGVDSTDHGTEQVGDLSLDGVITESPLNPADNELDRVNAMCERLVEMAKAKVPVIVMTGLRVYEDLVIASVSISRDERTGRAANISLSFQEFRTVGSRTVLIPPERLAPPVKAGGAAEVDAGQQSPVDAAPEDAAAVTDDFESLASKGFDFAMGGGIP